MSEARAKVAFELQIRRVELTQLLPTKVIKNVENLRRYVALVESIPTIGLTDPVVVYPQGKDGKQWIVLDGHLRLLALKQLGWKHVEVLVASEDDRYTYNARINRLPPIQCHKMIVKAVRNGVKPERIAAALNMRMTTVNGLLNLLDGINPEATELLREKQISAETVRALRKVSGIRQIEIAELMVAMNNYTKVYAEALILGTPRDQLVAGDEVKKKAGMTAEEIARMEREMESLEQDFKSVEATYTENMMTLTLARGYIRKLLDNARVVRFLSSNHVDLFGEFEGIATAEMM
jgi:hypothetical protein